MRRIVAVPQVLPPARLEAVLDAWEDDRRLVWCDETRPGEDPLGVLAGLKRGPLAILIGPEGGFSDGEREALRRHGNAHAIGLGPRIMRADTAAVAALRPGAGDARRGRGMSWKPELSRCRYSMAGGRRRKA